MKLNLLFGLFVIAVGFVACDVDFETAIDDYITENYANASITDDVEALTLCDGTLGYEVELDDDSLEVDLFFDEAGNLVYTATEVEISALPQAVTDAIANNYANFSIDDDDVEKFTYDNGTIRYEVELDGDTEKDVLFEVDGTMICEGTDDD